MINALFAMVEAKMEVNKYRYLDLEYLNEALETAKQEFDKAFMEAVEESVEKLKTT